jgi:hypothetical protein
VCDVGSGRLNEFKVAPTLHCAIVWYKRVDLHVFKATSMPVVTCLILYFEFVS